MPALETIWTSFLGFASLFALVAAGSTNVMNASSPALLHEAGCGYQEGTAWRVDATSYSPTGCLMTYGPYLPLVDGRNYRVRWYMSIDAAIPAAETVAELQVRRTIGTGPTILVNAQRNVLRYEFKSAYSTYWWPSEFTASPYPGATGYQFSVKVFGSVTVWHHKTEIECLSPDVNCSGRCGDVDDGCRSNTTCYCGLPSTNSTTDGLLGCTTGTTSTGTTGSSTSTTSTGTTSMGTTVTTSTGATSTAAASSGTASTGTSSAGTTSSGTTSSAPTSTEITCTTSTGTTSPGTTSKGSSSTGMSSTGTTSSGTTPTGTTGTTTTGTTGTGAASTGAPTTASAGATSSGTTGTTTGTMGPAKYSSETFQLNYKNVSLLQINRTDGVCSCASLESPGSVTAKTVTAQRIAARQLVVEHDVFVRTAIVATDVLLNATSLVTRLGVLETMIANRTAIIGDQQRRISELSAALASLSNCNRAPP
eukprot:TRINITY_DN1986_c1_g1_i1.p1 TRINITY_DN1986_c1_g1~~TRINITY_DN1986_c1_g1_i1.p1  ORF type:complete len:479 (+),score=126.93 TRINITY_DN1986_c1_g1_i1:200-1636(+)